MAAASIMAYIPAIIMHAPKSPVLFASRSMSPSDIRNIIIEASAKHTRVRPIIDRSTVSFSVAVVGFGVIKVKLEGFL